jgi:hypothetical protein
MIFLLFTFKPILSHFAGRKSTGSIKNDDRWSVFIEMATEKLRCFHLFQIMMEGA